MNSTKKIITGIMVISMKSPKMPPTNGEIARNAMSLANCFAYSFVTFCTDERLLRGTMMDFINAVIPAYMSSAPEKTKRTMDTIGIFHLRVVY
jgi:hypothetical protein